MAKYQKNHFLVFQGKFVRIFSVKDTEFLDVIVYEILIDETGEILEVFESDLKIHQFSED